MTTKEEISKWFDHGVTQGEKFMLVICDTYDWDDYPSYYRDESTARSCAKNPGNMQKLMEAYDLSQPKDDQLARLADNCFAKEPAQ